MSVARVGAIEKLHFIEGTVPGFSPYSLLSAKPFYNRWLLCNPIDYMKPALWHHMQFVVVISLLKLAGNE